MTMLKLNISFLLFLLLFTSSCSAENKTPAPNPQPIVAKEARGVWLPDPGFHDQLKNYSEVVKTVELLDELNFNSIYLCTYAKCKTAWKSEVLLEHTSYTTLNETVFPQFLSYTGGSGDPIKDLIEECRKKNIKVIFWFEYGFKANGGAAFDQNHPTYRKHPEWAGKDNQGGFTAYNNSDWYFNSYHPGMQQFMIDLILESIAKYSPDGIQGDDRLPAAPRNSGYDEYTSKLWFDAKGTTPPTDFNEATWVRFRLDILNQFGKRLYDAVKAADKRCLVSFSPNPHPWCEDNLMQDTPSWLKMGIVDILNTQCYRMNIGAYKPTVDAEVAKMKANSSKMLLAPGMRVFQGSDAASKQYVLDMVNYNRQLGLMGSTVWWFKGLHNAEVKEAFKTLYKEKAEFPY